MSNKDASARPSTMMPHEKLEKLRRRQQMQAVLAIQRQQQQFCHQVRDITLVIRLARMTRSAIPKEKSRYRPLDMLAAKHMEGRESPASSKMGTEDKGKFPKCSR
ncbi:unnamed protein product [Brassica rapa]|uniref:Uncharacterized protein n=1 Tax=Brassica campestris TaxID=3711 RepID=A0A3P5Y4Z9_BRACM|nr:unnamed protein product [Brassica rapa]VDC62592.1 unnamed protein product [Brassica rapa]